VNKQIKDDFMTNTSRSYPLVLGVALTLGVALASAGCNRQEATPVAGMAPSATTVGTEIDDTVVTTRVKSALLADQDVKGFEIKVETRKGMVQLSGFVDNQAQVERAIGVARAAEGVKGVENAMTLKDGKVTVGNTVDDGVITTRVKSALFAEVSVKSLDIAVVTSKGEVQLSGFVDNQTQIDRAVEVTRATEGARGVVNQLSIKK
jgi:hyperosmotically inducible protein